MAPILDRLRRRTPTTATQGAPTQPRSDSGRGHTNGFLDYDEPNQLLVHPRSAEKFDEMWRTDADVRRVLTMVVNAVVGGTWTVQPYGEEDDPPTAKDEEVARFVRWALMEEMRPKLPSHLWTAMAVTCRNGFGPFETIYKLARWNDRDVWTIKTLDLRLPKTIQRWEQDGPDLTALEQVTTRSGTVPLPARDLLYYRLGAEGDNWEGQSLLRPAFKHWRYKDAIEEIAAIGIERTAIGVPTGYPPEHATDDDLEAFEDFLGNVRANQGAYFMAPGPRADHVKEGTGQGGWFWEFVTPAQSEGVAGAVDKALSYHSSKIDATIVAEFMRLGQEGVGARATADVQQDPFLAFCEVLSQIVIEDSINEQLVHRLVDLNFTVDGRYPTLRASLIDSTSLEQLAQFVGELAEKGAIRPERTLEAYLRKRADLPEADEEAIAARAQEQLQRAQALKGTGTDNDQDGNPNEGKAGVAKDVTPGVADEEDKSAKNLDTITLARQERPLRAWEEAMSLDRIESAIDGARARLEVSAGGPVRAMAIAQARAETPAEKPAEKAVHDALAVELAGLYLTGRETVTEELARQRAEQIGAWGFPAVTLAQADPPEGVPEGVWAQLRARATAMLAAIRASIVAAVSGARMRRDVTPAMVQRAAEEAAMGALRDQAQQHASTVVNEGRIDQADGLGAEIVGSRYTSILDGRRCQACARADDDVLRPLDDPVRLERRPPNPDCHGGGRCRCLEAYQLREEEAPSG